MPPRKSRRLASVSNATAAGPSSTPYETDDDEVARKPKKRAKPSKATPAKRSRKVGRLSLLPTMPLDILFQIFEQLHPKDLLALTKVSKTFRTTLLAPSAVTIWKNARLSLEAPEPSNDFSEFRWAHLIFGPSSCHTCGKTTPRKIDFRIQRRLCKACATEQLVSRQVYPYYRATDPEERAIIAAALKLIPTTDDLYSDSCLLADAEAVVEKYKRLLREGKDGEFESWVQERLASVQQIKDYAELCDKWLSVCQFEKQLDNVNSKVARREAIKERLLALGHQEQDLAIALTSKAAKQPARLTDQIWNRILPGLERDVAEAKTIRLTQEKAERVARYTEIFKPVYLDYLRTIPTNTWPQTAPPLWIVASDSFAPISDSHDPPTAESFSPLLEHIPSISSAWVTQLKASLRDAVRDSDLQAIFGPGLNQEKMDGLLADRDRIPELAIMTYARTPGIGSQGGLFADDDFKLWFNVYPGYQGVMRVIHKFTELSNASKANWHLNIDASTAAVRLVEMAGLDPYTATPADMDQANQSFVCKDRQALLRYARDGKDAIYAEDVGTWRGILLLQVCALGGAPDFTVLDAKEETRFVPYYEPDARYSSSGTSQWMCTHCPADADSRSYHDVVSHIREEHHISQPGVSSDVALAHSALPLEWKGLLESKDVDLIAHCVACHLGARVLTDPQDAIDCGLMKLDALKLHLKRKHDVEEENVNLKTMARIYQPHRHRMQYHGVSCWESDDDSTSSDDDEESECPYM